MGPGDLILTNSNLICILKLTRIMLNLGKSTMEHEHYKNNQTIKSNKNFGFFYGIEKSIKFYIK